MTICMGNGHQGNFLSFIRGWEIHSPSFSLDLTEVTPFFHSLSLSTSPSLPLTVTSNRRKIEWTCSSIRHARSHRKAATLFLSLFSFFFSLSFFSLSLFVRDMNRILVRLWAAQWADPREKFTHYLTQIKRKQNKSTCFTIEF